MLQEEEYRVCLLSVASLLQQMETKYYVFKTKLYIFPNVISSITGPWQWSSFCPALLCNDMICLYQYADIIWGCIAPNYEIDHK